MEGERDGFPITAVREIRLLQHLRHKHVVSLQEVMVEKNECVMVFEYLSHDLTGLINHPTFKLTEAHKKHLAMQMFQGLDFLHRRGVLHRDIKAANILISNTGELKFADSGLARFYTKSRQLDYTNRVITIWYRPPELLLGETQLRVRVNSRFLTVEMVKQLLDGVTRHHRVRIEVGDVDDVALQSDIDDQIRREQFRARLRDLLGQQFPDEKIASLAASA